MVGQWILNHWAFCAFVLACFIQITPIIKFNPFTAVFKWVGHAITGDIEKRLDEIEKHQMEDEKDRIRYEVLDFANSCRNKRRHSKDEFLHIIEINDKYEVLLKKTKDTNGVFKAEFDYIMDLYRNCQKENDFLA